MRKTFIAGNWKMNMTSKEGREFAGELVAGHLSENVKIMVAPPFTTLQSVSEIIKDSSILLGAQNMSDSESGAHTGEISPLMLKELGVDVVILGHSERRLIYNENNDFINRKIKLALKHDFEVILCVGETLEEREAGKVEDVVSDQLAGCLKDIPAEKLQIITIAYEPVWAIGTGKTATPEDADNVHAFIRKEISHMYNKQISENIIIQYGGSVKPDNVKDLMAKINIDGALVGGASLKFDTFYPIVNYNY
ncbi:MAG: triose-phosphate isomerase [Spirochaetales bacterium]|nr:triose-phosphate isomerase [Spirochaetales bacterium]